MQAQAEAQFARRMFVYFYRIGDRFGQRVISLAVLADDDPHWRPNCYHEELAGCVQHFEFPTFKVLDCADAEAIFERTGNLFALVVAAHQVALKTRQDAAERSEKRFGLVKYLYRRGLERERVVKLFRVIEWLTRLPEEWELQFRERLVKFEQAEKPMTELLSVFEERAMAKGRQEGRQEGRIEGRRGAILAALEVRFGNVPSETRQRIEGLCAEEALSRAHRLAITAPSLQSFLDQL